MADTFNETATALVLHKQSIPAAELVRWEPQRIDEQQRAWYFKAFAEGVVLQINLAIRTLGTESAPGQFHWEYANPPAGVTIMARHDANNGTTDIRVGDIPVLSNCAPGRELLNPGQWLHTISSVWEERKAHERWTVEMERLKLQETKVAAFLKDV